MLEELDENAEKKLEKILEDNRVDSAVLSIQYEDEISGRQVIVTKYDADKKHITKLKDSLDDKIKENES